jgi:hypothetical protein
MTRSLQRVNPDNDHSTHTRIHVAMETTVFLSRMCQLNWIAPRAFLLA